MFFSPFYIFQLQLISSNWNTCLHFILLQMVYQFKQFSFFCSKTKLIIFLKKPLWIDFSILYPVSNLLRRRHILYAFLVFCTRCTKYDVKRNEWGFYFKIWASILGNKNFSAEIYLYCISFSILNFTTTLHNLQSQFAIIPMSS